MSPMMSPRPSDRTVLAIASVRVASTMPATRSVPVAGRSRLGVATTAAVMSRSPIDLDARGQAGHEAAGQWIADKPDLHRNALNDANEVPCRIVCGKQAEGRPAAGRKAVHHAFKRLVRVAVDGDADALTGPDMFDLGFLEVRHDPQIVDRNDIEQGGARRDKPADADLAIADDAADRRTYHGVVEIDLGEIARGLCLRHGGNGSFALSGKDGDALLLGLHRCRCRRHARFGSRSRRIAFIDLGLADGAAADKFAAAVGGLFARFISATAERLWASACRMRAC